MTPALRRFRLPLAILICVLGYKSMLIAFHWMNLPSDAAFNSGLVLLLVLLFTLPFLLRSLWRRTR